MSKITREEIEKVALLSRLSFTPAEADLFAEQMSKILDYAEKLNEVDTRGVEPTSHALALTNVFREDAPRPSLSVEDVLGNAPESEDDCFKVPQIIQESS